METLIYFLLWAGLFLVMMRFGCGSHVMGHGHHGHGGAGGPRDGGDRPGTVATPQSAVDPVCGMTVRAVEAKSAMYQGRAYYFCSASCREKFEANPAAFARKPGSGPQPMEHAHGSHH